MSDFIQTSGNPIHIWWKSLGAGFKMFKPPPSEIFEFRRKKVLFNIFNYFKFNITKVYRGYLWAITDQYWIRFSSSCSHCMCTSCADYVTIRTRLILELNRFTSKIKNFSNPLQNKSLWPHVCVLLVGYYAILMVRNQKVRYRFDVRENTIVWLYLQYIFRTHYEIVDWRNIFYFTGLNVLTERVMIAKT